MRRRCRTRIIVALDNVDCLPQPQAHAFLDGARRAFGHAGFIALIAADPARLAAAAQDERAQSDGAALEKWLQIPFRIGTGLGDRHYAALVEQALGRPENAQADSPRQEADVQAEKANSRLAPLDWSVSAEELRLLSGLAPLAGQSPRAVKRFVNLYRIARLQALEDKPILAFMLALDQGGSADEIAAVQKPLATGEPDAAFVLEQGSPRLDAALAFVWANRNVTVEAARRAAAVTSTYSLHF